MLDAARYSPFYYCESLAFSGASASVFVAFGNTVLAIFSIPDASVSGTGANPAALRSALDRLQRVDHIPHLFGAVPHP